MVKIHFLQKVLKNGLVSEKITSFPVLGGVQSPDLKVEFSIFNPSLVKRNK